MLRILRRVAADSSRAIIRRVLLTILVTVIAATGGRSQTTTPADGSTPLGLSPGAPAGSYSLSGFEHINPFNGNLNFYLPLASITGRGGAQGAVMQSIDEKRWNVKHQVVYNSQLQEFEDVYTPHPVFWSIGPGYSPGILIGRQSGGGGITYCSGHSLPAFSQTLTRLTFTAADGTEYELRDQQTSGQPLTIPNPCSFVAPTRGTVFVTADGSAATFISDSVISDKVSANGAGRIYPSGYLMLRDGTKFRIDGGNVTWMRDRNGNKLSFTYSSGRITTITDSLNRQITITYADFVTTFADQITFKGFGPATRTVLVNYTSLSSALRTTNPRNEPASRYQIQTYHGLFPELNNASSSTQYNPTVVSSITLPNGRQYQLLYNSYAELARVNLPTGGAIEYDYTVGSGATDEYGVDFQIFRRVIERRVYADGATLEGYTTYTPTLISPFPNLLTMVTEDHLNAGGTLLVREKHYYNGDPVKSLFQTGIDYPARAEGREYQTEQYAADGVTLLHREQTTWANRAPVNWWSIPGDPSEPPNDARVSDTTTTLTDVSPNLVSKQTFGYDDAVPYNNRNDLKEYDFGSGAPGSLVRETRTTYVTSTSYTDASNGAHLRSLPSQSSIYDAGGVERARTTYEYDNYNPDTNHASLIDRPAISGFDSAFSTSYTTRGNATGTTRYLLTNGSVTGSVSSYAQFDIAGNVVKTIDARGYATNFYFDDRFGSPDYEATGNTSPSELSSVGQVSYAFPTFVRNAANQAVYTQFDYYLGRPVNVQDANGIIFAASYNDSLDRPTQVIRDFNNLTSKSQTTFAYDDANRVITATSDQTGYGDNALKTDTRYDGLGRTSETHEYEGGTNYIAVQTQYDALGRAYKNSNPFRPWNSETAIWTTSGFDALSRVVSVTTPDSAVVSTSYLGSAVTVTDQAGKARKSVSDALGRVTTVYEDPNGLNYQTSYSYDVLDNLTQVSQGTQTRTFVYDSLRRLTSATNPESGTVSYQYDNNGNLAQKTDARGVVTTFGMYDALNRVTSRSYNDGTPAVTYSYDTSTRGIGRLASVGSSVSTTNYTVYDAIGRLTSQNQVTDGQTYIMSYAYNLAGSRTSTTYPSGRVVTSEYDAANRPAGVRDQSSGVYYDGGAASDATNRIQYAAHGAVSVMKLGNGLWEHTNFNNRLQPTEIGLGTSSTSTSVLGLTYNYGGTNNNGNVQSISYTGGGLSYTQSFGYDSLNRLTTSNENSGSSWSQTNGYDRYGNRWIDLGGGNQSLYFNTANRITNAGYSYDAAGNLTNDTIHTYGFDADNKIKTVDGVSGVYSYDGDNNRVRKNFTSGDKLRMVYSNGQLIAEYDLSNGSLKKEYIYGAKGLVATIEPTNGTRYTTSDHLGSPRVVTNSSAGVVSRHDYLPFGEELFAGTGGRTTAQGYPTTPISSDGVRQHFTGYERDSESGLDYAHARYYGSTQGRFTSPDPYVIFFEMERGRDANEQQEILLQYISQPQNWAKYSYGLNNPLIHTDPTGMRPLTKREQEALDKLEQLAASEQNKALAAALRAARAQIAGIINSLGKGQQNVGINVAVNAILNIGNPQFANSARVVIRTQTGIVIIGPSNKCNVLVGYAHALGAGLGFIPNGQSGRGYPLVGGKLPVANWLGDARDRQHLTNLAIVTDGSLKPGDIVAWRYSDGSTDGHSAIYIGGNVLVYAGSNDTHGIPKYQTLNYVDSWATGGFLGTGWGALHDHYVVRRYNGKP
jgi:RHS repeat-associated protein